MTISLERIREAMLVPVVKIEDPGRVRSLAEALLEAELPCIEITFRTAAAVDSIRAIAAHFPQITLGAGTVMSVGQARAAVEAGASFIVSPGYDEAVVRWCKRKDLAVLPGVATPTEIMRALRQGLGALKFFPAEALGGVRALNALAAPFKEVEFLPTGGVDASNLHTYLDLPMVLACGGSWLAPSRLIASGDFEGITERARDAVRIAKDCRARREAR